jgi:hypothetical protein
MKRAVSIGLIGLTLLGNAGDFYYENGKKIEVVPLEKSKKQEKPDNSLKVVYYKTSHGHKVGVKNDILVECNEGVNCTKVLASYNDLLSTRSLSETIFVVTIAKDKNIFEFAQKLYMDKDIAIAHPNFRKNRKKR